MASNDRTDPADRIREAQLAAGITVAARLAERAKVKAVTMRAYLNGQFNPPLDVCERLGEVLGVSGKWLFDATPPKRQQSSLPSDISSIVKVPLLDTVTAGRLADPRSQIPVENARLLDFADLGPGEWFATTVKGSSMDRVSPDGSIIVVNRKDKVLISGRCYIFALEGETTFKRWQGGEPPYLDPFSTDPIHKPVFIKRKRDFEVVGRVKRSVLDL